MNWFLIPLSNTPQSFQISLAGVNYELSVYWNSATSPCDGGWEFDLGNADTGESIIAGAPLVTGTNLFANLEYLGINGQFIVYTNGMPSEIPTYDNLGTDCNLYFVTDATTN